MSQQQQTSLINNFFNGLVGNVATISTLMPRLKNIDYNAQTNTTSIYGHTNFQELKVNGNSVALASEIPDITKKTKRFTYSRIKRCCFNV